jgi:hypothetical protein
MNEGLCISRRTICAVSLVQRGGILPRNSAVRAISVKRDRVTHLIELITLSLSFIKYISLWRKFTAGKEINTGKSLSRTIDSDSRETNQKLCYWAYISLHKYIQVYSGACRCRESAGIARNFHRRGMLGMLCAAFNAY